MILILVIGLATGCVYALVALGYSLEYRTTGVVNFSEGNYVMVGGQAIDDAGVPVVQHRAELVEQDHRHPGVGSEFSVGEGGAADVDGLGGCGDVTGVH